jgi:DNA invertase Pin-like site-specific DNA recombinase
MNKVVGYARVSTIDQNLDLQIDDLQKAGCDQIFQEKISGSTKDRPELEMCLADLKSGDTLMVWRIDRLGRSMIHLVSVINDLRERQIHFKSIQDGAIDTTSASGELVFNIFASMAQFERRLIQERTQAGLAAARARGKFGGRKEIKPNDPRVITAKTLHADKTMSIQAICKILNISKASLYRYLSL